MLWIRPRNKILFYYTLKECIDKLSSGNVLPWDTTTFKSLFYTDFSNAPLWDSNNNAKPYIEDLWKLVYARFYEHYFVRQEEEENGLNVENVKNRLVMLINILVMSYDKYASLLAYYEAKKNALLDKIKTTSDAITRFNDTPQSEETDSEFENDEHVTNINKSYATSESDTDTPIKRLKEIEDNYSNLMEKWSYIFDKLFIEEGNIAL